MSKTFTLSHTRCGNAPNQLTLEQYFQFGDQIAELRSIGERYKSAADDSELLRLRDRVERLSVPEPNSGCWIWIGGTTGGDFEYGKMTITTDGQRRGEVASRVSFRAYVGPIPDGFQVDHKCETALCVNPRHLQLLIPRDNLIKRAWHKQRVENRLCLRGHELDRVNEKSGKRYCSTCCRERTRRFRASHHSNSNN